MIHVIGRALPLALPAAALASVAPPPAGGVIRINAAPARPGWFVCDAVSGPYALFAGRPDARGDSVISLLDRRTGRFDTRTYRVGAPDPGAGQIYWPLSRAGRPAGAVHGINPGMVDGGGDGSGGGMAPILSVTLEGKNLDCRWLAHGRFLGVNARRGVAVTATAAGGLVYQAFDFHGRGAVVRSDGAQRSNRPTLRLEGGEELPGAPGGFRFGGAGHAYVIRLPEKGEPATLTVTRAGRVVGTERLVGFAYVPPAPKPARDGPLGPDAVWSGKGIEACRAAQPGHAGEAHAGGVHPVEDCLLDRMRGGGASAASIAFTRRLIAAGDPGYVSAWRRMGPVGVATVTYPFRANTNEGTWLIPAQGDPVDADDYRLGAADKARADYKAAQANSPASFPVPPGALGMVRLPGGGVRILVTTPTAVCHACAPTGSIVVGYDFDAAGRLLRAGLVAAA